MEEKPRIVVTRTRRPGAATRDFVFTADMLPSDGALKDYRLQAWKTYASLAMPTTREEAWRRTDLRGLPADSFRLPTPEALQGLAPIPADLLKPLISDQHGGQIVLTPGGASVEVDAALNRNGVIFTDLKTAERDHPELVRKMAGQIVRPEEGRFAALAGALSQNGVVLYVPRGVIVEQPLHSVLWGPGTGLAHLSHVLVWVDDGASLTYVHETASPQQDAASMHAGNLEIRVGDGAALKFVELQSWGRKIWNFTHARAQVGRDGNLDWIYGAVGSHLTKTFAEMDLDGEGASGRMSGFFFADGTQHLDLDTQQNHQAEHTTSDLLFKGALKGSSRTVWQGMIYVAPGAQKTDGYQANRNLILDRNARADSIPGLEILADDVRCSHGATVGTLEEEPLFYLQSRGIPEKEAARLVVEGFFDPIMQRIPFEGVRERFQQAILDKMAADENQ
ncbi:MAG: Fe-S cluster assembly protein SufD [Anaerolineales bacterium]|nr:Fe-S cluster assembly protein SufD [Anaerolineales bacterium]